jgi:hypothetical protein
VEDKKQRHGCLTAWLALMLLANSATALMYALAGGQISKAAEMPQWILTVFIFVAALNVVFTLALFQWKKWGFWGFLLTTLVGMVLNIIGGVITGAISGVLGVLLLYGVLQIGGEKKGWTQLE